jgi:broad specificity phosphatase PhoE
MLIVVRHGRTAANAAGQLLGRHDPPLDEEGRRQARAMADWLGPVDRVVSSPLVRARETAAAFSDQVDIDERWIELDYGDFDTAHPADIPREVWERWRTEPDFAPPGGESMASLVGRVMAAGSDLMAAARESDIVVVTHVSPIKAVLSWVLGGVDQVAFRSRVGQPSVTRVSSGPHGPVLQSFNEQPPPPPPGADPL